MTTPAPRPADTATIDKLIERVNKLEEAGIALATAAELTGHGFMQMGSHIDALAARIRTLESVVQTLGSHIERQHGLAPGEITDLFDDLAWWSQ